MLSWIQMFVTALVTILTSTGLWTFLLKRTDKNDAKNRVLIGLAHDRIIFLGMTYIERGYITRDEYENLHDYLFVPYEEMGGNGSAKRIMQAVEKLDIRNA